MKNNSDYKFAEKCLYEYKKNLYAITLLKQDLATVRETTDVKAQEYEKPIDTTCKTSDPVYARVVNIELLEKRITKLERITNPITKLKKELSKKPELQKVLTWFYFGGIDKPEVLKKLLISQAEFYRRRKQIIFLAIGFLQIYTKEIKNKNTDKH